MKCFRLLASTVVYACFTTIGQSQELTKQPICILSNSETIEIPDQSPTSEDLKLLLEKENIRFFVRTGDNFEFFISEAFAPLFDLQYSTQWLKKIASTKDGVLNLESPEGKQLFDSLSSTMRTDGIHVPELDGKIGIASSLQIDGLPTIDSKPKFIALIPKEVEKMEPLDEISVKSSPEETRNYFDSAKWKPTLFPKLRDMGSFKVIDFGKSDQNHNGIELMSETASILKKLSDELLQLKRDFDGALDSVLHSLQQSFYEGPFKIDGETPFNRLPKVVQQNLENLAVKIQGRLVLVTHKMHINFSRLTQS